MRNDTTTISAALGRTGAECAVTTPQHHCAAGCRLQISSSRSFHLFVLFSRKAKGQTLQQSQSFLSWKSNSCHHAHQVQIAANVPQGVNFADRSTRFRVRPSVAYSAVVFAALGASVRACSGHSAVKGSCPRLLIQSRVQSRRSRVVLQSAP